MSNSRIRQARNPARGRGAAPLVLTVGHSTHPIDEFVRLLEAHGVACVADVRTIPRSRHNPQFNRETLPKALRKAQIAYVHLPGLGGLRRTSAASPNTGWRNASFRGFADYMQTPEFESAVADLLRLAGGTQVVLMCAEAVPWRCHRSLIADALLARGVDVEHIMSASNRHSHRLTPFARIRGTRVTYPPEKVALETPSRSRKRSTEPKEGGSRSGKNHRRGAHQRTTR